MELFGLIGIKDIIDILIVATILFYIYKIMKESGTLNIFLGVLSFIIIWFVASVFLKMLRRGSASVCCWCWWRRAWRSFFRRRQR